MMLMTDVHKEEKINLPELGEYADIFIQKISELSHKAFSATDAPPLIVTFFDLSPFQSGGSFQDTLLEMLSKNYLDTNSLGETPSYIINKKKYTLLSYNTQDSFDKLIDRIKITDVIIIYPGVDSYLRKETFEFINIMNNVGLTQTLLASDKACSKKIFKKINDELSFRLKPMNAEQILNAMKRFRFRPNELKKRSSYFVPVQVENIGSTKRLLGYFRGKPVEKSRVSDELFCPCIDSYVRVKKVHVLKQNNRELIFKKVCELLKTDYSRKLSIQDQKEDMEENSDFSQFDSVDISNSSSSRQTEDVKTNIFSEEHNQRFYEILSEFIFPGDFVEISIFVDEDDKLEKFSEVLFFTVRKKKSTQESSDPLFHQGIFRKNKHIDEEETLVSNKGYMVSMGWRRYMVPHIIFTRYETDLLVPSALDYCYGNILQKYLEDDTKYFIYDEKNSSYRILGSGSMSEHSEKRCLYYNYFLVGNVKESSIKNTVVHGMFKDKSEARCFLSGKVQTQSGIRGIIKSILFSGNIRVTFEGTVMVNDRVLLKLKEKITKKNIDEMMYCSQEVAIGSRGDSMPLDDKYTRRLKTEVSEINSKLKKIKAIQGRKKETQMSSYKNILSPGEKRIVDLKKHILAERAEKEQNEINQRILLKEKILLENNEKDEMKREKRKKVIIDNSRSKNKKHKSTKKKR